MEVSLAKKQTKLRSLFAMPKNKKLYLIVSPGSTEINGFVRVTASFAILISGLAAFCNTYFCSQSAKMELTLTKNARVAVSFANWS